MRERIYKALLLRYQSQMEEALLTIDALLQGDVVPGHEDLTGSTDKLLDKVAAAKEKLDILRQYYGTNQAEMCPNLGKLFDTLGIEQVSNRYLKVSKNESS